IQAVGGFAANQTHFQSAALLRRLREGRTGQKRVGEGSGDTEGCGATEKVAPAKLAGGNMAAQEFQFFGHHVPHSGCQPYWAFLIVDRIVLDRRCVTQDGLRHSVAYMMLHSGPNSSQPRMRRSFPGSSGFFSESREP